MRLKLWVRIVISVMLLISDLVVYLNLGYSTNWYEIVGWCYIFETFVIIDMITPELRF